MGKIKENRSTRKPVNSMKGLEEKGFISELIECKKMTGKSVWKFKMGKLAFHHNNEMVNVDFSKYHMKIVYNPKKRPPKNIEVWIENLKLPKDTKHIYPNETLCLFKPENFKWKEGMTIEKNLFSTICTWLYHYEVWKSTGIWHGEEAKH
jgi:hypothetical protein